MTPGPGQRQGLGSVVCSAGPGSRAGSGAAGITEVRGGLWNWGRADQGESRGHKGGLGQESWPSWTGWDLTSEEAGTPEMKPERRVRR